MSAATTRSHSPSNESAPIHAVGVGDAAYPAVLGDLPDPPDELWWMGDWSILQRPLVAVVGTRRATSYGLRITREITGALARGGACVVSGMALGIDGAAHRAALESNGATIAVLGTGADVAYPRSHSTLHREIIERGLVMS
ncbi:MAG TPA: DNA-processing protein DprA, partial [Gemmatimonadaceae bacterium]|nr:DNA-processing protein DprA [Gemmatimonadaceae bacterium]